MQTLRRRDSNVVHEHMDHLHLDQTQRFVCFIYYLQFLHEVITDQCLVASYSSVNTFKVSTLQ